MYNPEDSEHENTRVSHLLDLKILSLGQMKFLKDGIGLLGYLLIAVMIFQLWGSVLMNRRLDRIEALLAPTKMTVKPARAQ